jgi:aspartyl-tRNA(Asn)/glutamyl-tRNA(Gln) amidotransferase subunit B
VRRHGDPELGTRTELKNINSFRFVEKAINFEIERQIEIIEDGGRIVQETRLYDPGRDETRPMRGKEEAHDYRYFPDPDLPPLEIDENFVEKVRRALPELPDAKRRRFVHTYGLTVEDADTLTGDRATADYFEAVCASTTADGKTVANWVTGEIAAALNRDGTAIDSTPVAAESVGTLLDRIADGTISGKIAKDVFQAMWETGEAVDHIIESRGLKQISDSAAIEKIIDEILDQSAAQIEQYRNGQSKVLGYLVGQVMKRSQGKANPKQVNEILRKKLDG